VGFGGQTRRSWCIENTLPLAIGGRFAQYLKKPLAKR
jgi:hypothetical protein